MQTSVELQEPFSYSLLLILIALLPFLLLTLYYGVKKLMKVLRARKKHVPEVQLATEIDAVSIRKKYLEKMNALAATLNGEHSEREVYQELSMIIRLFVFEMTHIKVQSYSLNDIKRLGMFPLSELVEEYYAPEFSEDSRGDVKASLEKTRKVIEEWTLHM